MSTCTPNSSRNENSNCCFGFLRSRRTNLHNNDATLACMRPPSPNEAAKWSNSFSDLVNSKYGQALFKRFLQSEHSEENLEFWLAVEKYRKTNAKKLPKEALKIYNEFISSEAHQPINLSSTIRNELLLTITTQILVNHFTFDKAQTRIRWLLENDCYYRFLSSELYLTVRLNNRIGYQDFDV